MRQASVRWRNTEICTDYRQREVNFSWHFVSQPVVKTSAALETKAIHQESSRSFFKPFICSD